MTEKPTTVNLPAIAVKGFGRNAEWSVSVNGVIGGRGATLSGARENATENVTAVLGNMYAGPAFGQDDDGTFIVAVPHGSGTSVYRLSADGWRLTADYAKAPREVIDGCPHYRAIPAR